jgi:formate dehydrogenase iron-sulfur subunit
MPVTGFFTDSTLCIGCKACEVACKEWNDVPHVVLVWTGMSYDNTGGLGHSTWRHVKFVERLRDGLPAWDFSSDVCKHCEHAGCLEACPTGSIVRTEFGGVFIQPDVCNGCGYCVVACPFGVVDRRPDDGRAFKCTFCYDRQKSGLTPACAKACPTESIQFGPLEELRERARKRIAVLEARGHHDLVLYDPVESSVRGIHAFFLVPGDPAAFGLPASPEVPSVFLRPAWRAALLTSAALLLVSLGAFWWG